MATSQATLATVAQIIKYADTAADVVLPLAGFDEFAPVIDAVSAFLAKLVAAAATKAPPVDAEIAAADAAFKASELAAGLK